jgi:hypothetical protein
MPNIWRPSALSDPNPITALRDAGRSRELAFGKFEAQRS